MREAFHLLLSGDVETWGIVLRSLHFSAGATALALLPGIPIGIVLGIGKFPGRRLAVAFVNALTAVPTVVIGLAAYSALSRSGPFGPLGWLFAPAGVIAGQSLLALPIVATFCCAGLSKLDPRFHETLDTLGTNAFLKLLVTIKEARSVFVAAAVAAFGRVTGEVGVSMMLGGNIRRLTRTMTTAIALDAAKGEFDRAVSLGLVLLVLALLVNLVLYLLTPRSE